MKSLLISIALLLAAWTVQAQTCPTPAQLVTDLTAASQGTIINLSGVLSLTCPEVSMSHVWDGGKLLFSDAPETVSLRGKLYEDTTLGFTSGTVYNRVHAHHVNGRAAKMKFAILLKNNGTSSGSLIVQQKGVAGPTADFLYAGKLAFLRWLQSVNSAPVSVPAGSIVRLAMDFETQTSTGNLMTILVDYSFTQNHTLTVCALDTGDNPVTACPGLAVLPRDTHQRGTFPNNAKVYDTAVGTVIDTAQGIMQLPLAGNTTNDPDAVGVDKTDGSPQQLKGNYGVLYKMHLNTSASDSKKLGFLFNPRGGVWGGAEYALVGITPGGKFLNPTGTGGFSDNTKGAVSAKYNPGTGGLSVWMQWMPTSASNYPLRYIAVPH